MAGGFSIEKNKKEKFKEFIIKRFRGKWDKTYFKDNLYIDSSISASALNINFYQKVEKLSPFGSGNPEPKFILENVKVIRSSVVGDSHVK